ncbi:MAG TPA: peroxiredoxin [Planctomycetota bacterium]|nr:peroxiredoxin [Planctomycetota bacterium]
MFFKKKGGLLKAGDEAPDFSVQDHEGRTVRRADLAGQRVLLYWYPKADTPGCTAESCGFRDRYPHTTDVGRIYGVSFDTPADNKAFAQKYKLPFPLLCDTTKVMSIAYGAAADGSAKYPDRVTYVLAADGTVESAEKVTDIPAHVDAAVAKLRDV